MFAIGFLKRIGNFVLNIVQSEDLDANDQQFAVLGTESVSGRTKPEFLDQRTE
jgi:hypothetical protein